MTQRWECIDKIIGRVELFLLVTMGSAMILMAFSQIVLRNVFSTGIGWGDALVRSLVLWTGFIGAAIATQEGKHICIDAVSRWVPPKGKRAVEIIIHAFSCAVCCLLVHASLKFIKNEIQMNSEIFLGIPSWVSEIILPLVFGVMALRYFFHFLRSLFMMHQRERQT